MFLLTIFVLLPMAVERTQAWKLPEFSGKWHSLVSRTPRDVRAGLPIACKRHDDPGVLLVVDAPETQTTPPIMASASKLSTVEKAVLLLASLAFAGVLLEAAAFWRGIGRARSFAGAGRRFERRLSARRAAMLILGDSTGVGVGATLPEESIAGLLAADYPDADIVNVAVSGTRVADAIAQVRLCLEAWLALRSGAAARRRQRRRRRHAAAPTHRRLRRLATARPARRPHGLAAGPPMRHSSRLHLDDAGRGRPGPLRLAGRRAARRGHAVVAARTRPCTGSTSSAASCTAAPGRRRPRQLDVRRGDLRRRRARARPGPDRDLAPRLRAVRPARPAPSRATCTSPKPSRRATASTTASATPRAAFGAARWTSPAPRPPARSTATTPTAAAPPRRGLRRHQRPDLVARRPHDVLQRHREGRIYAYDFDPVPARCRTSACGCDWHATTACPTA